MGSVEPLSNLESRQPSTSLLESDFGNPLSTLPGISSQFREVSRSLTKHLSVCFVRPGVTE